jgi:hypothetical protein
MHVYDLRHYPDVLKEQRDQSVWYNENRAIFQDAEGIATSSESGNFRSIGVLSYLVEGDVLAFRSGLSKSALMILSLFERFEAGEPISQSVMTIGAFRSVFDALAAGDFELAQRLSAHVGRWKELDATLELKSVASFGYMLKAFVDGAGDAECREALSASLRTMAKNFSGYKTVLNALLDHNLDAAQKGFIELIAGHKRESKGTGEFANVEEELISVWGVGLANLCCWRGLPVEIDDPLIPAELLVEMAASVANDPNAET